MRNPRRELQHATLPLEAKAYAQLNDCNRIALFCDCSTCKVGVVFRVYLPLDASEEPKTVKEHYFVLCSSRKPIEGMDVSSIVYASASSGKYLVVVDDVNSIPNDVLQQCKCSSQDSFVCVEDYRELVELI